ncbi:hypothetical protein [Legionella nagasakiensis]|uniref:hypothetical protein n=1 Tax=Legionella nagasakiensis TaxID=535290 RepID=UPI0013EF9EC5|nr:hypothetical protein [Legionella nagasakiensis]
MPPRRPGIPVRPLSPMLEAFKTITNKDRLPSEREIQSFLRLSRTSSESVLLELFQPWERLIQHDIVPSTNYLLMLSRLLKSLQDSGQTVLAENALKRLHSDFPSLAPKEAGRSSFISQSLAHLNKVIKENSRYQLTLGSVYGARAGILDPGVFLIYLDGGAVHYAVVNSDGELEQGLLNVPGVYKDAIIECLASGRGGLSQDALKSISDFMETKKYYVKLVLSSQTHGKITASMMAMNYMEAIPADSRQFNNLAKGVCAGIANIYAVSSLLDEQENFEARIAFIDQFPSQLLIDLISLAQTKAPRTGSLDGLPAVHTDLLEMQPFFDSVIVHQNFSEVSETLFGRTVLPRQELLDSFKYMVPAEYGRRGITVSKVSGFAGAYDQETLTHGYFAPLQENLRGITYPVSFLLSSVNHRIAVVYHPHHGWSFCDGGHVEQCGGDIEKLAGLVVGAFSTNGQTSFTSDVYVNSEHASNLERRFEQTCRHVSFQALHRLTADKLTTKDSYGHDLAKMFTLANRKDGLIRNVIHQYLSGEPREDKIQQFQYAVCMGHLKEVEALLADVDDVIDFLKTLKLSLTIGTVDIEQPIFDLALHSEHAAEMVALLFRKILASNPMFFASGENSLWESEAKIVTAFTEQDRHLPLVQHLLSQEGENHTLLIACTRLAQSPRIMQACIDFYKRLPPSIPLREEMRASLYQQLSKCMLGQNGLDVARVILASMGDTIDHRQLLPVLSNFSDKRRASRIFRFYKETDALTNAIAENDFRFLSEFVAAIPTDSMNVSLAHGETLLCLIVEHVEKNQHHFDVLQRDAAQRLILRLIEKGAALYPNHPITTEMKASLQRASLDQMIERLRLVMPQTSAPRAEAPRQQFLRVLRLASSALDEKMLTQAIRRLRAEPHLYPKAELALQLKERLKACLKKMHERYVEAPQHVAVYVDELKEQFLRELTHSDYDELRELPGWPDLFDGLRAVINGSSQRLTQESPRTTEASHRPIRHAPPGVDKLPSRATVKNRNKGHGSLFQPPLSGAELPDEATAIAAGIRDSDMALPMVTPVTVESPIASAKKESVNRDEVKRRFLDFLSDFEKTIAERLAPKVLTIIAMDRTSIEATAATALRDNLYRHIRDARSQCESLRNNPLDIAREWQRKSIEEVNDTKYKGRSAKQILGELHGMKAILDTLIRGINALIYYLSGKNCTHFFARPETLLPMDALNGLDQEFSSDGSLLPNPSKGGVSK